jgi:hydroxymethylpyrimidine/phosphomethylpyrimidine kinase
MEQNMIKNILTIAGSDSSGGAGIQADIKTISALGGYAMSVITAVTAQNTSGVKAVKLIEASLIKAQLDAIFDDIRVDAIKIGMLGSAEIITTVAECLKTKNIPIVLDPVMVAKSGDPLLDSSAVNSLKNTLLPLATLITPNLPEAAVLLGQKEANSRAEMEDQAKDLLNQGVESILLKGGHLKGKDSPDLLASDGSLRWFEEKRFETKNTHGTGCTLSSALATFIGKNYSIQEAILESKGYITNAIKAADRLCVGNGHGPTNHFWSLAE